MEQRPMLQRKGRGSGKTLVFDEAPSGGLFSLVWPRRVGVQSCLA